MQHELILHLLHLNPIAYLFANSSDSFWRAIDAWLEQNLYIAPTNVQPIKHIEHLLVLHTIRCLIMIDAYAFFCFWVALLMIL